MRGGRCRALARDSVRAQRGDREISLVSEAEPTWHRRARRERASARVLVNRSTLALHHARMGKGGKGKGEHATYEGKGKRATKGGKGKPKSSIDWSGKGKPKASIEWYDYICCDGKGGCGYKWNYSGSSKCFKCQAW